MTFEDLNLNKPLWNALEDMAITTPTTIQQKAFPVIMSGKDVVGIAQTGTGKTLAYLLPCLRLWKYNKKKVPTILVLVPTRELVKQVQEEIERLATYMSLDVVGVYGGTSLRTQSAWVMEGADILVATPGRLIDLVMNGVVRANLIKKVIIDEVDEMLNLGFRHQLITIFDLLPPKRQNLMFSATLTTDVANLIDNFFDLPIRVEAAPTGTPLENIDQQGYYVPNFYTKVNLLNHLLEHDATMDKVLLFAGSKKLADKLFETLEEKYPEQLGVIHSNKSQNKRFNMVNAFKAGESRILIATDLMSRGLDISEVSHVVNFDMPEEAEDYIHRIGRTGRAEKNGVSISFIREKEMEKQGEIEQLMKYNIQIKELPEEIEIIEEEIPEEQERTFVANISLKTAKRDLSNSAFHEKKEKNKKVNKRISHESKMRKKYKKPKTRGSKSKRKRK